jgi:hypothetical protein
LSCVTAEGLQSLYACAVARENATVVAAIDANRDKQLFVHNSCRKKITRTDTLKCTDHDKADKQCVKRKTRSSDGGFDWRGMCFLCGDVLEGDKEETREVKTSLVDKKMAEVIAQRGENDDWSLEVKSRMALCTDLFAVDARYHVKCYARFVKKVAKTGIDVKCGRPVNTVARKAFEKVCEVFERNVDEMFTVSTLHKLMVDLSESKVEADVYGREHMLRLLEKRYEGHIFISHLSGKSNVVCLKNLASNIVTDKWFNDLKDSGDEKSVKIVKTAARLIRSEIKDMEFDMKHYPSGEDMYSVNNKCVPPLLQTFMEMLVVDELKQSGLAQAIIQCSRPRTVLMPLIFGLSVSLDHKLGSTLLLDMLHSLGLCMPQTEVRRFKQSVMQASAGWSIVLQDSAPFLQFVADNVDHNVRTLNGFNTFHGMGIIACCVDERGTFGKVCQKIPRLDRYVKVSDLCKTSSVTIFEYNKQSVSGLSSIVLKQLRQLQVPMVFPAVANLNTLRHAAGLFTTKNLLRPNWSGFMQHWCQSNDLEKRYAAPAEIHMLPIIDLSPSDASCIYSTLLFVIEQSKRMNIGTPCVTFDQPLYLKAFDVAKSENLHVVLRLGGFHTVMSYLGSIGKVMRGSGFEELFGEFYGPNTVEHIMNGKANARAIRGHMIVHSAVVNLLLDKIVNGKNCEYVVSNVFDGDECREEIASSLDCEQLKRVCKNVMCEIVTADVGAEDEKEEMQVSDCDLLNSPTVITLEQEMKRLCESLKSESRTFKLWLLYVEYVETVKMFLMAERTCNWLLHLHAIQRMLPLFAAAGHGHYAKSARLYLQSMMDVHESHPVLYEKLVNGFHAIRRSDRYWAGLSSDLVIEKTMMKAIKSTGGLTRGRGITESVRTVWLRTLVECAKKNLALSTVTGTHRAQEDHVDLSKSRMTRDAKDLQKVTGVPQQSVGT